MSSSQQAAQGYDAKWLNLPKPRDWYSRASIQDLVTISKSSQHESANFYKLPTYEKRLENGGLFDLKNSSKLGNSFNISKSLSSSRCDSGIHLTSNLIYQDANSFLYKRSSNENIPLNLSEKSKLSKYKILPSIIPSRQHTPATENVSKSLNSITSPDFSSAFIGNENVESINEAKYDNLSNSVLNDKFERGENLEHSNSSTDFLGDHHSQHLDNHSDTNQFEDNGLFSEERATPMSKNDYSEDSNESSQPGWAKFSAKPPLLRSRTFEILDAVNPGLPVIENDLDASSVLNAEGYIYDSSSDDEGYSQEEDEEDAEDDVGSDVGKAVANLVNEDADVEPDEDLNDEDSLVMMEVSIGGLPLSQFLSLAKDGLLKPRPMTRMSFGVDSSNDLNSSMNFVSSFRIKSSVDRDDDDDDEENTRNQSPILEEEEEEEDEDGDYDDSSTYSVLSSGGSKGKTSSNLFDNNSLFVNFDDASDIFGSFDIPSDAEASLRNRNSINNSFDSADVQCLGEWEYNLLTSKEPYTDSTRNVNQFIGSEDFVLKETSAELQDNEIEKPTSVNILRNESIDQRGNQLEEENLQQDENMQHDETQLQEETLEQDETQIQNENDLEVLSNSENLRENTMHHLSEVVEELKTTNDVGDNSQPKDTPGDLSSFILNDNFRDQNRVENYLTFDLSSTTDPDSESTLSLVETSHDVVLYVKFPDESVVVVSTKSEKTLRQLLDRFRSLTWRGQVIGVDDEHVDELDLQKTIGQLGIHDCSTIYLIT